MDQQTYGLNDNVGRKGCKYLCHLRIAEYEASDIFTVGQLNRNYFDHKKYGWLKNQCDIIKPNEIMADFINDMGGIASHAPRQLGRIVKSDKGSKIVFWDGSLDHIVKYCLVEFKTDNGFHWILFDSLMNELYDSWTLPYNRKYINSINLIG